MSYDSELVKLFEEIAPTIGATIHVEPKYRNTARVQFFNGKVLFFRRNHLNVNVSSNARMASDKSFLSYYLNNLGFDVPAEITVSRHEVRHASEAQVIKKATEFTANYKTVIVKPNSLSQGKAVRVASTSEDVREFASEILSIDRICIIQEYIDLPEYRLVVLNGELLQAYRRIPAMVTGDGSSSLSDLVQALSAELLTNGRIDDREILHIAAARMASHKRLDLAYVPHQGEQFIVADAANLSMGGKAVDVASGLHARWIELASTLAAQCGLLLCGIDIFIEDISDPGSAYRIIEINSSPGLDDYLLSGEEQKIRVVDMYTRVLKEVSTEVLT